MKRLPLWRLPIILSALLVAICSLLIYANAAHRLVAGVPIYSDTVLQGVQLPVATPVFDRAGVRSGNFMRSYATNFARHFPLLAGAVRLKSQIYWTLLHQSPTWYISVGRDRVLYENVYLDEYCTRDFTSFAPIADQWASKLVRMQKWYAAHGKIFLYLLTPSKASIEPLAMPAGRPCPASPAQRTEFHAAYSASLRRAGVNFVDAVDSTQQAEAEFPFAPFPAGGTHFNQVSTALAVQRLIATINTLGGWRRIDDFEFDWRMGQPDEVDTDLLDALNVPFPGLHYQVPKLTVRKTPGKPCEPVLMAQVGGSFLYQIDRVLDLSGCPPKTELYEYFRNRMAFYPGDRRYPVDPKRRDWALTDEAQIVVLEENEELAARSQHGEAMYDLVMQHIRAESRRTTGE